MNNIGEIEIKLNSIVNFICEVKEEEVYIIISLDDKLYKLSKNYKELDLISPIKINKIIQINKNEYIISNDNGVFKYVGSLLKITKENSEIFGKKITIEKLNFGVLINQRVALVYKNKLILYNNYNREIEKILKYEDFFENCYALFKCRTFNILDNSEIRSNIMLFSCKNEKKYGYLWLDIENNGEEFIETDDFQISCFLQIKKNKKAIIRAFSEIYDKNYIYFLAAGYDLKQKENKIRLGKFYKLNRIYKRYWN